MYQKRASSYRWLLLGVMVLLGLSLLFVVGCDSTSSDDTTSTTTDSETSTNVDTNTDGDLVGPVWTLTQMAAKEEGADAAPIEEGITATIEFNADGTYHAQAPVNILNGTYTLDGGDKITINDGAMTRMIGIDDAVNAAEDAFVAHLTSVATYKVLADSLSLYDTDGILVLEFEK